MQVVNPLSPGGFQPMTCFTCIILDLVRDTDMKWLYCIWLSNNLSCSFVINGPWLHFCQRWLWINSKHEYIHMATLTAAVACVTRQYIIRHAGFKERCFQFCFPTVLRECNLRAIWRRRQNSQFNGFMLLSCRYLQGWMQLKRSACVCLTESCFFLPQS